MDIIRKRFIFHGRVQGVGFRYRASHSANMFGVTGFVRNLPDGSVELEAQGPEESIDRMVLSIEQGTYILIENCSVKSIPTKDERSFTIK